MRILVQMDDRVLRGREIDRLRVKQRVGEPHRLSLSVSGSAARLAPEELVALSGASLEVRVEDDTGETHPLFSGEVRRLQREALPHHGWRLRLEAASLAGRLAEQQRHALYPESTLESLAGRFGVKLHAPAGDTPRERVQAGESDWDFLVRLAAELGLLLRATPEGAEVRQGFAEQAWPLAWGRNLLRFHLSLASTPTGVAGAAHDLKAGQAHRFGVQRVEEQWLPGAEALRRALGERPREPALARSLDGPPAAARLAAAGEQLQRASQRLLGERLRLRGQSTHAALRDGDRIRVEEGTTWQLGAEGEYGLVEVVHRWDGAEYRNRFEATLWAGYHAPARRRPAPPAGAPVRARVEANADPEGMGRIRVRYRWMDEQPERTLWLPWVTPYAGSGRGLVFLPEVGDEVYVAFENGDPERPLAFGAAWNGRALAPEAGPENTYKQILTRSGNRIRLVDEAGRETIEVVTAGAKAWLRLSNQEGGAPRVEVGSTGDLHLRAPAGAVWVEGKEIHLRASGPLTAEAQGDFTQRAGGSQVLQSAQKLALAAGGDATLSAGGTLHSHAGGQHRVTGAQVQLNPPGAVLRPPQVQLAAAPTLTPLQAPPPPPDTRRWTSDPLPPLAALGARAAASRPPAPPPPTAWIEFELRDEAGALLPSTPFVFHAAGGQAYRGTSDAGGIGRIPALLGGSGSFEVPADES